MGGYSFIKCFLSFLSVNISDVLKFVICAAKRHIDPGGACGRPVGGGGGGQEGGGAGGGHILEDSGG